jgi:lipid A 3-O-deacylase
MQWGSNTGATTATVGLIWDGRNVWRPFGTTKLSYYTELSLGHWRADDASGGKRSSHTEFGLTPTLRLEPLNRFGLFAELGIGAHLITPNYRRSNKRFSTEFNFGDHIGIGVRPESWKGAEISLRYQHFSNAGIKQPNSGDNFVQLRLRLPL